MNTPSPVVLVTGASRGIGQAIAETFALAGYLTIGTATSEVGGNLITERLQAIHSKSFGLQLDVTNEADRSKVLAQITEKVGSPTVLINNAGITRDNLFMRMSDDEWDSVINTNLSSVFRLTKTCIKSMVKARYGRVINIASIVGATGNPGQANYAAAKAAIMGFTRTLARELGARNITANCIAPGFIDTDMTRELSEDQRAKLIEQIPLKTLGQPQDIADLALYLVDKGRYISGQTLHVNGGMYVT